MSNILFAAVCLLAFFFDGCSLYKTPFFEVPPELSDYASDFEFDTIEILGHMELYQLRFGGRIMRPWGRLSGDARVLPEYGPGVWFLARLYDDSTLPVDLNCRQIVLRFANMGDFWSREMSDLASMVEKEKFGIPIDAKTATHSLDFPGGAWISDDLRNLRFYSGIEEVKLVVGKRQRFIRLEDKALRILYVDETGRLYDIAQNDIAQNE